MGRKRKAKFQKLPKYVYDNNGTIIYRQRINGDLQRPVRLGNSKTPLSEIWSNYEALIGKSRDTLQYIVDQYFKGDDFKNLKSHKEVKRALGALLDQPVGDRIFGQILIVDVSPGVIRKYLDYRNNVSGNREISYLSKAWSYCYERDIVIKPNPCKGVRRKTEKPRTRYVTDEEYQLVFDLSPKYVKTAMELAYLCRMRLSETLDTRVRDIQDKGLHTRRLKGSNDAITLWSDRLRFVIDRGLKGQMRVPDMPIVNNGKGSNIRVERFKTAWQRLMKKVVLQGIKRFTFQDLKAKGVSDFEGDKKKASGHKSDRMVDVYDRKITEIESTN
jgi:integrase